MDSKVKAATTTYRSEVLLNRQLQTTVYSLPWEKEGRAIRREEYG